MNYIVTGLICSGKSTFLNIAKEKKFKIFKSDDLVADCYNDQNIVKTLKERLNITSSESDIKKIIKNLFLKSEKNKDIVESILHPIVHSKIIEEINSNKNIMIEVPAIENNRQIISDNKSIFIESTDENRLKYFTSKKPGDVEFFKKVCEYQKDYSSIKSYCDIIIKNNSNIENLHRYFNERILRT